MPTSPIPKSKVSLNAHSLANDGGPFMSVQGQCRAFWCWAAVCVSIAKHYGIDADQSIFAQQVQGSAFPSTDCTIPPCDATLVQGSVPAMVLPVDQFNLGYVKVPGPLSESDLATEMRAHRPVGAKIIWRSAGKPAGGHYIAIVGMTETNGKKVFHPSDPMDPSNVQSLSYAELVNYQLDGDWKLSWRRVG